MRDRLVTLCGAALALAVVYALFVERPQEPPVSKPLTTDAGRNGYLGISTWLERQPLRVVSWRERYPRLLDDASLARSGNLLIVTMPFRTPLRSAEVQPLRDWVARGNSVLVLAALDDSPEWLPTADQAGFRSSLAALTGLLVQPASGDAAAAPGAGPEPDGGGGPRPRASPRGARAPIAARTEIEIEPLFDHPLLANAEPLRGYSDDPSELWRADSTDFFALVLRLGRESSSGVDALWQLPRGGGQIVLAASGSLLANRNVGEGGARELVRNLIRRHVASDGAVLFDDMHQGLSSLYDAAALFRDERLTATLWFVLAAWLVYILGSSNRLAPPRVPSTAPRQYDFLVAAGGFMARRLDEREAGSLLIEEWLDEVRRARGLARDAPVWEALEATPALERGLRETLRGYHRKLAEGRTVSVGQLHEALRRAREAIG